ncbi:MAG: DUF3299 domain-containing protein [Pseudomonadota bacterium]
MSKNRFWINRRAALALGPAALIAPKAALSVSARVIEWIELLPPGVPYPEIIAEGEMDEFNDLWRPVYDENATLFNDELVGLRIRMPGFVIPMEIDRDGVKTFLLVPYVGACLHVPPPPPNQLIFVTTIEPWPYDDLWAAVWVTGVLTTEIEETDIGVAGYAILADEMELYEW